MWFATFGHDGGLEKTKQI